MHASFNKTLHFIINKMLDQCAETHCPKSIHFGSVVLFKAVLYGFISYISFNLSTACADL